MIFDLKEFNKIYKKIESEFPFLNYINLLYYWEMRHIINLIFDSSIELKGKNLLDIGSGPMDKTAMFACYECNCFAVDDLSDPWHKLQDNQDLIKDFGSKYGINFYHQTDQNYQIPFKKNFFDIITSFSVVEHLHNSPALMLKDIGIHLTESGYGIIVTPNSVNLRKRIDVLLGRTNYNPIEEIFYTDSEEGIYRGHVREYTLSELRKIVEWSGFKIIHSSHFEHIAPTKLNPFLSKIYKQIGNLITSFRSANIVIFQKPNSWKKVNLNKESYFLNYPAPKRR